MSARRPAVATGAALAVVLLFAGCTAGTGAGDGADGMDGMDHDGMADESAGWNEADIRFAQMMIPHHEQAIVMSELVLDKEDVAPEVADLAEQIKAAQGPEIDQMESWLADWDAPSMTDGHAMGGMDGLLTEQQMDALEGASGATASTLFLEGMIEHHEGAIDMAEEHQDDGEHEEALELSAEIIETQSAEIERMQQLLAG